MSFYKRYELSRLICETEARTFAGVQRDTGRPVFLHLLARDAAATGASDLAELIQRAEAAGAILDSGEFAGTGYYVTERMDSFPGLRKWLQQFPAPAAPAKPFAPPAPVRVPEPPPRKPPAAAAKTPPPPGEMGEFTRLFRPSQSPPPVTTAPQRAKPAGEFTSLFDKPGTADSRPRAAAKPPGEFTSLFGGGGPAPKTPAPSDPESDDFNRVFRQSPATPPPKVEPEGGEEEPFWPEFAAAPPAGRSPSGGKGEGEFTRFFGNPIPGEQIDIAAEQAKNAGMREESSPFQAAGGFTRVFGPPSGAKAPPPPRARTRSGRSASRMFSAEEIGARRSPAEESPTDQAVKKPRDVEPGEYTRMISLGGDAAAAPTAPPTPAAPPRPMAPPSQATPAVIAGPSQGKRALKIVFIVLGTAVGMGVLFTVVYLLMSRFVAAR